MKLKVWYLFPMIAVVLYPAASLYGDIAAAERGELDVVWVWAVRDGVNREAVAPLADTGPEDCSIDNVRTCDNP